MVAWCTKPGRGTRLIPQYALQGVQFIKTPNYVQVAGFIDQRLINLDPSDYGGEMDPHGADLRGNPKGGLVFSQSFNGQWTQVPEWNKYVVLLIRESHLAEIFFSFIGGNAFCFKACDSSKSNAADYCQHIYDRIGCAFNAPNNAKNGTFESCKGENQDFPGVYTSNGQVMTYTQPPESLGPITTMPYTPHVPASSDCVTYASSAIYTGLPTPSIMVDAARVTRTTTGSTASGSRDATAPGASNTSSDASTIAFSGIGIGIIGVVFSSLFLA